MTVQLKSAKEFGEISDTQEKFARANPNPVLSSAAGGELQFTNPAALSLMHELGLNNIESLLPQGHKGLVRACLSTGENLTADCDFGRRIIAWTYQPSDEAGVVYIYGYDVTKYQTEIKTKKTDINVLPKSNPDPVVMSGVDGIIKFNNFAVTQLLDELGLLNISDVLPENHAGLLKAAAKTRVPITEERGFNGRTLVWTYKLSEISDEICIYGHDLSSFISKIFSIDGVPRASSDPVLSTDKNGVPKYINYAASRIVDELGVSKIEDILPRRHSCLVRACAKTNTPLYEKNQGFDRNMIWSYQPVKNSGFIYINGHDMA